MKFEIKRDDSPFYGKYIVLVDDYPIYKGSYLDYALSEAVGLAWKEVREKRKSVHDLLFDVKTEEGEFKNLSFMALVEILKNLEI